MIVQIENSEGAVMQLGWNRADTKSPLSGIIVWVKW